MAKRKATLYACPTDACLAQLAALERQRPGQLASWLRAQPPSNAAVRTGMFSYVRRDLFDAGRAVFVTTKELRRAAP